MINTKQKKTKLMCESTRHDINYAMVEEKRPPIYTAMKYWGKKPHNIWGTYIETYTDNIFLDPFCGSAMSAFEAVRKGKKAIAFDLNPLTAFIVEVFCSTFNKDIFLNKVKQIVESIATDKTYIKYFTTQCKHCNSIAEIQNFKWNNSVMYEIGVQCDVCKSKYITNPSHEDTEKAIKSSTNIKFMSWYPNDTFQISPSFQNSFVKNIGGNKYKDIWTARNLYVLSSIFDKIITCNNDALVKQLLFGFIQTLHLCSKMCVPRSSKAKRDFSTSWGRSAYICSKKQMEMNPLLLFYNSCIGKQSVESSLSSVTSYLGKIPKIRYVSNKNDVDVQSDIDIFYGIVNICELTKFVNEKSVDFIITDPPYGGLVQYLDLSCIWLVWLQKYDSKYGNIDLSAEITVKKGIKNIDDFQSDFTNGITQLHRVLKDNAKIIFTFHNKDLRIWNAFLRSLDEAGFEIENVIHQQNRRTGESNVSNPYGTSASDYYIRCAKVKKIGKKNSDTEDSQKFEDFVTKKAVEIIKSRNEPTPYQLLFNGLLAELSRAGLNLCGYDENIKFILKKHINSIFTIIPATDLRGDYWWLINAPEGSCIPLSVRVERTIFDVLAKREALSFDEIVREVFHKYQKELTPDLKSIQLCIEKIAKEKSGKWYLK